MAQFEHVRLVDILQDRIAAAHVAVERGVADRHFRLVAGRKHHMAELVGNRHQRKAARPRLDILFRLVGLAAVELRRQHRLESGHRRTDIDPVEPDPEQFRCSRRIFEALLRGVGRRHHDRPDLVWAQGVDGDGRGERRIDAARKAQDDARKTVLPHIVPQAEHHRLVNGLQAIRRRGPRSGFAGPARAVAPPVRHRNGLGKAGQLDRQRIIRVDRKGKRRQRPVRPGRRPG